jgi:hypothetical protein
MQVTVPGRRRPCWPITNACYAASRCCRCWPITAAEDVPDITGYARPWPLLTVAELPARLPVQPPLMSRAGFGEFTCQVTGPPPPPLRAL